MPKDKRAGVVIAGGGLAGSLAALALAKLQPEVPLLLIEQGESFGGDHIWPLLDGAVADEDRWLVDPMVSSSWPGYYVSYPDFSRKLRTGYAILRSADLDHAVRATLRPDQYLLGTKVVGARDGEVILPGGERIRADGVIDSRGPAHLSLLDLGWCKSLAQEYSLPRPHRLDLPVMIDATVDQDDGFHFFHCVPLSESDLLVEDIYYSNGSDLALETMRNRIGAYLDMRGWRGGTLQKERTGTSPIALDDDPSPLWRRGTARVAKLGLRGGFFHPANGHVLADAVHTGLLLAGQRDFHGDRLHDLFQEEATRLWRKRETYRQFNAMLFGASDWDRRRIMENLWRLEPGVIARFYCDQLGMMDRRKVLGAAATKPER